jgi:PhnB protein
MKKITPDIMLEKCAEKLKFYQSIFGGEIKDVVTTPSDEVMHAELHIAPGMVLYFHDVFHYEKPVYGSIVLVLEMDTEKDLRSTFEALKEGGGVRFDIKKTDWNALHGVVEDKHGLVWSLNYSLG